MKAFAAGAAAAVALLLVSCSEPEAGPAVAMNVKEIPGTVRLKLPLKWEIGKVGGTWRDTYQDDPKSYNPFSNLDGSHLVVTGLMFDSLFEYDRSKREWQPNLVKSWDVKFDEAADTMELTCTLRDDVFWSDGVPMTAEDVVWWYNELEGDPDIYPVGYQGQYVQMKDGSKKHIDVALVDRFRWKYVFPRIVATPTLMVNASEIVPKHIWEPVKRQGKDAVMKLWGVDTPPEKLVGNGAFLLESNSPGERLVFKRNPNYWKKDEKGNRLPYIEKVVLTQVPEANAELLKFQQGEIESYGLRGQDLATLLPDAQSKGYSIWNGGPSGGYPALIFNFNPRVLGADKQRWFTNRLFRQAVSSLVDRETIINQTINGLATPEYHVIAEDNRFYNPARATPFKYDPAKAAALLAEAGFKDVDGDKVLEDADGKKLAFGIMTGSQDPVLHDYLNIIITEMARVGIKATLQVVDTNLVAEKILHTHDWDAWLTAFSFPTFPEQWYNVWRSDGNLHYWNPKQKPPAAMEWEQKIDGLYEQLIFTYREEKITELYDEFQRTLMDELVIIPIFRRYTFTAVYDRWGNVNWDVNHSFGDNYTRLYLK